MNWTQHQHGERDRTWWNLVPPATPPVGPVISITVTKASHGIAPLLVHVDCSGTTDVITTTNPFHDIMYVIDFGDGGVDTPQNAFVNAPWVNTNRHYGPIGGHVYETPGTFTITVRAINGAGAMSTATASVTVGTFIGKTYYVDSGAGNDANSDAQAQNSATPWATFNKARTSVVLDATNGTKVLFKRGSTWAEDATATGTAWSPTTSGEPFIFGPYGAGAKPIINMFTDKGCIVLSNAPGSVVMELDLRGDLNYATQLTNPSSNCKGINGFATSTLVLRVVTNKWLYGISTGNNNVSIVGFGVVDCESKSSYAYGFFFSGDLSHQHSRVSFLANKCILDLAALGGNTSETYFRTQTLQHSVASYNIVRNCTFNALWVFRHQNGNPTYVELNHISDNILCSSKSSSNYIFSHDSSSGQEKTFFRDNIFERNIGSGSPLPPSGVRNRFYRMNLGSTAGVYGEGRRMTIRNNVSIECGDFVETDALASSFIGDIWMYHNVQFCNETTGTQPDNFFYYGYCTIPGTTVRATGNLLYLPAMISGNCPFRFLTNDVSVYLETNNVVYAPNSGVNLVKVGATSYPNPWQTYTGGVWTFAANTLEKAGAFANLVAGDWIETRSGTGVTVGGRYQILTRTSNDSVVLASSIASADNADTAFAASTWIAKSATKGFYTRTLQPTFHFGPTSFTAASFDNASKTITKVGAFAGYTFVAGDYLQVTGGTAVIKGVYPIASKTNNDALVLWEDITSDATGPADVTFTIAVLRSLNGASPQVNVGGLTPGNYCTVNLLDRRTAGTQFDVGPYQLNATAFPF